MLAIVVAVVAFEAWHERGTDMDKLDLCLGVGIANIVLSVIILIQIK